MWLKRLILNKETLPYVYISKFLKMKLEDYLKCNIMEDTIDTRIPEFYREILAYWFSEKTEPIKKQDIQREVIWLNKYILKDSKPFFNNHLYNNGCIYIDDLVKENGHLLTHLELTVRFGNYLSPFDYMCLIDAIPAGWRHKLRQNRTLPIHPENEAIFVALQPLPKPLTIVKSRELYHCFNNREIVEPPCIQRWRGDYNV
jgi:hypothetical protein